jgi:hypothetical protein
VTRSALLAGALAWAGTIPLLRAVLTDADRGLDAMDESHYLLAAQPWAADKAFNGMFGWYSGRLLRLLGEDLGLLRLVAAALLIVAALGLGAAVTRFSEHCGERWPAWLRAIWPPAVVAAALCYYTVFVRTPSYNWFAALGLMLLAAGLLHALCLNAARAGVLVGLGAALTAVGKATTAVGAVAVLVSVVVVQAALGDRGTRAGLARTGLVAAATGGALAVAHLALIASPALTMATFRRTAGMLAAVDPGHYAPGVAYRTAVAGVRNVLFERPWPFLVLLLLPVLAAVAIALSDRHSWGEPPRPGDPRPRRASSVLAVAFVWVWLLTLFQVLRAYPGGVPGLAMSAPPLVIAAQAALLVAVLVWWWSTIGVISRPPGTAGPGTAALACAGLLAMGVAYPLGTNVEYATQLHGAFGVLAAAAVIGLGALPRGGREAAISAVAAGSILLGAVLVPITREVAPYRIPPLSEHVLARSVPASSPPIGVDADTAAWIDGLRDLGGQGGFAAGTPMLDLTWHPASVLAMDGRPPTVLLPAFPGWPDPAGSAAFALRQEDPQVWRHAWLLVPVGQDDALTDRATSVVGRRFPGDYQQLGTVTAPYDRQLQGLWRPR